MNKILTISLISACAATFVAFGFQPDFAGMLAEKLDRFYERHKPVKIHLIFNQPAYAPGDTAFFKVHFFTADGFHPVEGRQIVNIQVLDGHGQIVFHEKVLLVDGEGVSQLPIGGEQQPGRYTVVAFSEVMRNVDPALFYRSPLWISGSMVMEEGNSDNAVEFHPEGGHFIGEITNKVVVTAPPNSTADIVSEHGNKVATVQVDENGMGSFFITPRHGVVYHAEFSGGKTIELPPVEKDGVGILASAPNGRTPVRVTLQVPPNSFLSRGKLMLVLTAHAEVYFAAEILFNEKNIVAVSIPTENVRAGISQLSVFRSDGSNVANRLLYIGDASLPEASIVMERKEFATREKVPLTFALRGLGGQPLRGQFTVTVYRDDFTGGTTTGNKDIVSNALFYGDLAGSLNSNARFHPGDTYAHALRDNFLITQKWTYFTWDDVWNDRPAAHDFREYLHLSGRAFLTGGGVLPDSTLISFFLQKSVMTYEVYPDASGRFDFPLLFDFYGREEIFYRAESKGKSVEDIKVELDSPFSAGGPTRPARSSGKEDPYFALSAQRQMIDKSYSFFLRPRVYAAPPSLNTMIEEEVFGADVEVKFEDYFLFPTMAETLREIIPLLEHRKQKGRDVVRLFFDEQNRHSEGEPLFIIDGVITDNTAYFLGLKPAEVISIKVIHTRDKLQNFGRIGKNGIVLVETKIPDNAASVPRSGYMLAARGLATPSASPRSEGLLSGAPRVPDLRTNLYWNPAVATGPDGTATVWFNASDVTGRFRVKIEGLTEDGKPFAAEDTFRVAFQPR